MMCSNWKISVFGIVALMLAFGLATTDTLAATDPSPVTVTVSATPNEALRATGETVLTFTITIGGTGEDSQDPTDADPSGTITISTPRGSGWSSPRFMTSREAAGADAVGAPTVNGDVTYVINDGDNDSDTNLISVDVSNYQLKATVKKGALYNATIRWQFKTALPNVAKDYSFGISSNVHKTTLTTLNPGSRDATQDPVRFSEDRAIKGPDNIVLVNAQRTYDGRGRYIVIDVGPVPDGTGKIVLTRPSFPKGAADYKVDGVDGAPPAYDYAGQYLITKEQALGNLVFTFTPAGSMLKGSTVTLNLPTETDDPWAQVMVDGDPVNQLRHDDAGTSREAGEVTVSGADITSIGAGNTSVTATTTGKIEATKRIVFTIGGAKAPAVTAVRKYTFTASSGSRLATAPDTELTLPVEITGADGEVTFVVTNPHGTGKVESPLTNVNSGAAAADMTLTFTAAGAMLEGSVVEIKVPAAWSPSPFKRSATGGLPRAGEVGIDADSPHSYEVANRVITVTLGVPLAVDGGFELIYAGANPPDAEGEYEFTSRANSHKQGTLGAIASPKINVIVGDGSGTIKLARSNGQAA